LLDSGAGTERTWELHCRR